MTIGICSTRTLALVAIGLIAPAAGCDVFDASLYEEATGGQGGHGHGGSGGTGGAGGAGGTATEQWASVDDACPYDPEPLSSMARENGGRALLNDLADDVQTCGKLTGFDGPDGVIGLELGAGELVHVEVDFVVPPGEPAPPVDLGVYMMNTCDSNACAKRVERCPEGVGEHFAWAPDAPGEYFFGFDSKAYDQDANHPEVQLSVTFPLCANGKLEKGETCDDGNLTPLDGCDEKCNAELLPGGVVPTEVEPNNYYITGNVVGIGEGEMLDIKGYIGGGCDLDFFALDIPEGGFARVRMLGEDGEECPSGTPEFPLEFDDPSGSAELGKAKIPAVEGTGTNHCPEWDETSFVDGALPAGRYVIEMKPFDKGVDSEPFAYILEVEIIGPVVP